MWNWQHQDWPNFNYDASVLLTLEREFLQSIGGETAVLKHLSEGEKKEFIVEILCNEGVNSAEIEGEILERESLQSSIRKHFGLQTTRKKCAPNESGMGELLWNVYHSFDQDLSHEMLFNWHKVLMQSNSSIEDIGKYRTHPEAMQIVSGRYDRQTVYFEAPPSSCINAEMTEFIGWFNKKSPENSLLARAAICHVYFESIHPFEDGNGRIGRALVEKMLSMQLGYPVLVAISQSITKNKKAYYQKLATCNRSLKAGEWVLFFAKKIVEAQTESLDYIHFLMQKSKLMNHFKGKLNARQEKVLLRIFSEGTKGFSGGLSADNYISITKTSRATATRDLEDLIEKNILKKTGTLRHTRYWLKLS